MIASGMSTVEEDGVLYNIFEIHNEEQFLKACCGVDEYEIEEAQEEGYYSEFVEDRVDGYADEYGDVVVLDNEEEAQELIKKHKKESENFQALKDNLYASEINSSTTDTGFTMTTYVVREEKLLSQEQLLQRLEGDGYGITWSEFGYWQSVPHVNDKPIAEIVYVNGSAVLVKDFFYSDVIEYITEDSDSITEQS